MNEKTVYVINHCNQWHEYASFRLIGVVDKDHLQEIVEQIKKECNYSDQDVSDYIDINNVTINDIDI